MSIKTSMKAKMRSVDRPGNIGIIAAAKYVSKYDGSPNGALTGELLELCWDYTNSDIYINTDGGTTWVRVVN